MELEFLKSLGETVWKTSCLLVYPPLCSMCAVPIPLHRDPCLCEDCIKAVLGSRQPRCPRCGDHVPNVLSTEKQCSSCRKESLPYQQVVILATYEGMVREAVTVGKRSHGQPIMVALGTLLADQIRDQLESLPDLVTYVPSDRRRMFSRGTSSAETLGRVVSRQLGLPFRSLLKCRRHIPKQAMLKASQRESNVAGAFGAIDSINAASVLLVDDVMTTGATARACTRELSAAGAGQVFVAATARGAGKT